MSTYRPEIAKMLRTMPTGWRRQYNAGRRALAALGGPVLPDVPTPEQAVHLMMLAAGATRLDKGGDRPLGDYPVPQDVRDAAMVGLRMSYKMNYGADHFIGIARAIQLAIVDGVPPRTKDRMRNYFTRHRKDKQGRNFNNEEHPSNGRIAWENWGGDAGFSWVARQNPPQDEPENEEDPELAKYAYTVGRGVTSGAVIKTAVAKGGGVKGGARIIGRKAAGALGKSAAGKAIPIVGEALMVVDASRQGLRELGAARRHADEYAQAKGLFAKGKVVASRGGAALGRVAAATLIGPEGIEIVAAEMEKGAKANPGVRARRAPKTYLFSYGSNSPRQLAERLGHSVKGRGAYVEGYLRAFRGWSSRWEGGVATLIPGRGMTFGYIAEVTPDDLAILDRYEGVATGNYRRVSMQVTTNDGETVQAIAYLASSSEKNAPSRAYKRAVAETIGAFWEGEGGPVTEADITVRNPSVARRFMLRDIPTIAYIDERLPEGSVVLVRDTPNWKADKNNMVVQIRHGASRYEPYTLCQPHETRSTSGKSTISHYGGRKDGHREEFLRQYMLPGETVNITLMRLHDEIQHRLLG